MLRSLKSISRKSIRDRIDWNDLDEDISRWEKVSLALILTTVTFNLIMYLIWG